MVSAIFAISQPPGSTWARTMHILQSGINNSHFSEENMKRRTFIRQGLAAISYAALGRYTLLSAEKAWAETRPAPFSQQLFIPPILDQTQDDQGDSALVFAARKAQHEFFPGTPTDTIGYNGSFLGPTIRVRNGENVRFAVSNKLDQVTTVHWHGLHVPALWDGGPHQVIEPGAVWRPQFQIKQQAATLWYHPHAMGLTGEHVYRGLAGLFIIDDEVADALALPADYGVDDIPLIIQDRRFFENSQFAYVRSMHDVMNGVLGNYLMVNGMLQPALKVGRGISRFRLLNGSNSSIYRVRFSDERPVQVIGSDGGLLSRPVAVKEIILAAGERAEFLLDCSGLSEGDRLRLMVDQSGGNTYEAMQLEVSGKSARQQRVPEFLREQPAIAEKEADKTRYFAMQTMSGRGRGMGMMGGNRLAINGKKMDMNRIDEKIALGSTEIWEIENRSTTMMQLPHSMHLHDVQFNILERNGQPPSEIEAGRKDTVLLWPNDRVRIISRFADYTGVYMYHCHMLEHEDDGMMGQFEVVNEATRI